MKRFGKILVGVDLSWGDQFVAEELSPPNAEAVRQAIWLARMHSASIEFLFSLDVSAKAQELIEASRADESNVLRDAKDRLALLVEEARAESVPAYCEVVFGNSWLNLVHQVLRNDHDLVLVGSRHKGAIQGWMLGSTGSKLLRACPCAVWITQPPRSEDSTAILVAQDLRPVGDIATVLGCSMAELEGATLHVLHAVEYPELEFRRSAVVSAERKEAYMRGAEAHIRGHFVGVELPREPELHFVTEPPDIAILDSIERYKINLLVMGTMGQVQGDTYGLAGNTIERVLPRLQCSLLAVKPPGFKSPIALAPA